MDAPTIGTLLVIGIVAIVVLVLRELLLWYFRINQRFDKLEQIEKNQQETNRLLAQIAGQPIGQPDAPINDLQRSE